MDIFGTYFELQGDLANPIPVSPSFWPDLIAGKIGRLTESGWLLSGFQLEGPGDHWEMHPNGDELLIVLSGALTVVFEGSRVELTAGGICKVPRGAWHTVVASEPSKMIALTCGRGTETRGT
jgi:mannose-6-phosphate isomerase-like protein (cupin superfamily)